MTGDFQVRLYNPGDEEEIVKLLELVFNGWPQFDLECTSLDHWRWKYLENPFKKHFIVLATADSMIIGANQILPIMIKMSESTFPCVLSADTVVHPDYRGRGVYTKMANKNISIMNDSGIKLDYFPTSNPILIKSYSKRYETLPFPLSNLVRIRDIKKQLEAMPIENALFMRLGFQTLKLINDIQNTFRRKKITDTHINIQEVKSFNSSIDQFWDEISEHYKFIVERRKEFLNWRYCDVNAGGFIVNEAKDDDGFTLGYSAIKINRYLKHYSIGYIVDLLTLPDKIDVVEALVAEAIRYFDEKGINIINCLIVKNHPHEKILKSYGFLDSRLKINVFMRSSLEIQRILKRIEGVSPDRLHFSYGDIDSLPSRIPLARI